MADIGRLANYLQAQLVDKERARARRPRPFITISRQAGAGGRSLADAVLAEMARDGRELFQGWHAFDDELCEIVASDPKLSVLAEALIDEQYRSPFEEFLAQSVVGVSPQATVFKKIFKTIRGLAEGGKAIIVGRAGRWVTRRLEGGVHIRLVAPKEIRLAAVRKRCGLEETDVAAKMRDLDRSRDRLVRRYFSADVADPVHYDAVLNLGAMPLPMAAKVVLQMVADRVERADAASAVSNGARRVLDLGEP
ncbi:MAG: cytidylate kinase-like family protein [Elusimicrobia bacterium]|nr:cytidylate kinase-like family protein [Elusimicrobiota bacterium]